MQIDVTCTSEDDPLGEDLEPDPDLGEAIDLEAVRPVEHSLTALQPAGSDSCVDHWLPRLDGQVSSDDSKARIAAVVATTFLSTGVDVDAEGIRGRYRRWTFRDPTNDIDLLIVLTPPPVNHKNDRQGTQDSVGHRMIRLLKHWNQVAIEPQPSIRIEVRIRAAWVASSAVRAAYAARDAVVHGEPADSRSVVAHFVATWLGLRPTTAMARQLATHYCRLR